MKEPIPYQTWVDGVEEFMSAMNTEIQTIAAHIGSLHASVNRMQVMIAIEFLLIMVLFYLILKIKDSLDGHSDSADADSGDISRSGDRDVSP